MNNENKAIKSQQIPLTSPVTLQYSSKNNSISVNGITLPLSVPFSLSIQNNHNRKKINKKIAMTEQAWVFQGIIFDEYVIDKMNKNLTFIEEVKSRILTEVTLVDRNHLQINWFGNELETVKVYKKLDIDDKYETDDVEIPWSEGGTTIALGDGSYNILIDTPNKSGISGVINISDTNYNKVKSDLKIALNEKTHYLTADFKQTFNIKIDF